MKTPRSLVFGLVAAVFLFAGLPGVLGLKIACALQWIEHTPQAHAIRNFYKADTATLVSGGVASLSDKTVDLGANAETQGLKQYATRKNYRLIYIIVEATYRLVANKAAGITKLSDLKGKRVGTVRGSSAEVFVRQLLASAGLSTSDYTTVTSGVCMKAPCGENTFPTQFRQRKIDAYGLWESTVQLGIQAVGEENVVIFKNPEIYREIYSLYSTTEKLSDPRMRAKIVQFVKALNQSNTIFHNEPERVYESVGQAVKVDVPVLKKVWEDHKWGPGDMGDGLLEFLVREDKYLAQADRRSVMSRAELAKFIDTSVYEEAMKLPG